MTPDVSITPFELPLRESLQTASATIESRRGFILEVDGAYGEATPLPGWTETLDECEAALHAAVEEVRHSGDWQSALEQCVDAPAARHAVELAHLDQQATRADDPLAGFLADTPIDHVPVNDTIGQSPSRETAAHARRSVTSGFDCLKIKVGGRPVPGDVERLRAVRSEVGPDVELRADANGSWTPEQAREALDAFDDLDVTYVEQPLPADDLTGLADLRADASVDVAVDETLAVHSLGDVLMAGAADVVVLKPMALGGIHRTLALALRATELGVTPVVTTTIDAVIARTAALHLAAALGHGDRAAGLATAHLLESDLTDDPAPVRNGTMRVPNATGLGIGTPRPPSDGDADG